METFAKRYNNSGESVYLLAFVCYLINTFLNHTMFEISFIKIFLFSIVIVCCLIKFFFIDKHTKKEFLLISMVMLLILIVTLKSGNRQLLTLSALVVSAKNVNFKNVLFIYIVTITLLLFFTFLCSMADIIPNLQYTRAWGDEIKIRNSFGTIYPTIFASYILYLLVAFSYFMNTKNLLSNLMFIMFSVIGFFICIEYAFARMSAYSILLYLFVFYFVILFCRKNKIIFSLSIFIYPLFFIIIYYLSSYYNPSNGIMASINSTFSGRLYLGNMALNNYPLTLFGQNIEFIGLGGAVQDMGVDYNYVDSSYLQFLLRYGVLFSILSVLIMMKITYERIKLYDYKFIAIIFMISLSSMIEDRMLDISVNIYWVLILAYYFNVENPINKRLNNEEIYYCRK